jgi:hypothetical protein
MRLFVLYQILIQFQCILYFALAKPIQHICIVFVDQGDTMYLNKHVLKTKYDTIKVFKVEMHEIIECIRL